MTFDGNALTVGVTQTNAGACSTIAGGETNAICLGATHSTIGGGTLNTICATEPYGTIAGGYSNVVDGDYGAVLGGRENCARNLYTVVGGGWSNDVTGICSGILGGFNNTVACSNSFAIGSGITAQGDCATFVNKLAYYAQSSCCTTYLGTAEVAGEIVYFGNSGISTSPGRVYYLNANPTSDARWSQASANSSATNMLAIALGTNPSVDRMLVRGFARFTSVFTATTYNIGQPLYLSTTAGLIQNSAPSGTGQYVRIVGYTVDQTNEVIYFCPDNTWIVV